MFDTHAHLDDPRFHNDLEDVIVRAGEAGVDQIISVGTDLETSTRAVQIAGEHEGVYATVGFHPHAAADFSGAEQLEKLYADPEVVAIGEIGLDYYRDRAPRDAQQNAFRRQIELAIDTNLPIIVHNREADDDCLRILGEFNGEVRGVAHCFSGDETVARKFMDLGFYISFSGTVTFPNTRRLADAARMVPDDRILVETDCPYLAPQARRGKRNEPAFVKYAVEKLAELRGTDPASIGETTALNATALFL